MLDIKRNKTGHRIRIHTINSDKCAFPPSTSILSFFPPNVYLPGVVDVVDEVLNDGGGVGELDGFGVMGDNDARDGLDSNNTLLVLIASMDLVYSPG